MFKHKLNLGLIDFINCLPINHCLLKWNIENLSIIKSYPSDINDLMREGRIDIAPVSSIEYLNNLDNYVLIENACISSDGEVCSVVLFSRYNLEELEFKRIGLPYTSNTSIELLKIILNEHGINLKNIEFKAHRYQDTVENMLSEGYDALLFIGDPALVARIQCQNKLKCFDLGQLWKELTGYPMTFGCWIARLEWKSQHEDDFLRFCLLLDKAVDEGMNVYFNEVADEASKRLNLNRSYIEDYLGSKIKYGFGLEHAKGLQLFKNLYDKLKHDK